MVNSHSTQQRALTLQELIALNDEIGALVWAGIPLDRGLKRMARDMPRRVGRIAERLGEELDRGVSLPEALESSGVSFPPVYRAVVEAGIRSGRLAAALETVAHSTRRLAEARRMVTASLIYPVFVFLVACQLFMFFVMKIAPAFSRLLGDSSSLAAQALEAIRPLGRTVYIWGPGAQLFVVVLFVLWAHRASRASLLDPGATGWLFGWLPWLGSMTRSYRQAAFAEMLHLLIKHELPLPEAIRLAANAAGTKRTRRGG